MIQVPRNDFGGEFAQTYTESCKCGKTVEISTQIEDADDGPDYYTDIYVKCACGKSIYFKLPVT